MADHTELQKEIASLFLEKLNVEVSSLDEDLIETGVLDSLKTVELLTGLEQRYRLKFSVNDLEIDNFRSIARIADFVVSHSGGGEMPDPISVAS